MDTTKRLHAAMHILGIPVAGVVDTIGMCGNLALFFILFCTSQRTSLYIIMEALSLVDALNLIHNLFFQVLPLAYELSEHFESIYQYLAPLIPAAWPFAMASHMASVWLTLLISAERWIAVCMPLYRHQLVSVRRTRIAVGSILCTSIAFNLPRFLEYRLFESAANHNFSTFALPGMANYSVSSSSNEALWQKTDFGRSVAYAYGYSVVMYALFVFLIPLLSVTVFNFRIIATLRREQQTLRRLSKTHRHESRTTLMPIYIAILFCVFETPAFLINIADATGAVAYPGWQLALVCSTLLVMINSATNFLVYCVCTRRFRLAIRRALRCPWRVKEKNYFDNARRAAPNEREAKELQKFVEPDAERVVELDCNREAA